MQNIILSADNTADLNGELIDLLNVSLHPYTVIIDNKAYRDNIDIKPSDIFKIYEDKGILPKTAAINLAQYVEYFKELKENGREIIHINLASSLTSAYNNCQIAAGDFPGVYALDSQNLSTGSGLLVLKARHLIDKGLSAKEVVEELENHREKIHMSFLLDTLEFLQAGGRCSKLTSLGANLLKIKPVINVDNQSGTMSVGSKYKGSLEKSIKRYICDKLTSIDNINEDHIFLVHSGLKEEYLDLARKEILKHIKFKEIYISTASCTISSHCGPNTIGIAFETK